jgi:hypothetical protein
MIRLLTLLLVLVMVVNSIQGQEKMSKKEKKEKERIEAEALKQEMLAVIDSRLFVLEATRVQDKVGQVLTLTPTTNFVSVTGENVSMQIALDGRVGWNGLGGITLDGRLAGFKVNEGKPGKYFTVTLRVSGAGMYSHQFMTVYPDGRADLEVSGDGGARFVFMGKVVPYAASRIYKGMPSNR